MRCKYVLRLSTPGDCTSTAIFAVRWDNKRKICTIGGSKRFLSNMRELAAYVTNVTMFPIATKTPRFRFQFKCGRKRFKHLLFHITKSGYDREKVDKLRRMMS